MRDVEETRLFVERPLHYEQISDTQSHDVVDHHAVGGLGGSHISVRGVEETRLFVERPLHYEQISDTRSHDVVDHHAHSAG